MRNSLFSCLYKKKKKFLKFDQMVNSETPKNRAGILQKKISNDGDKSENFNSFDLTEKKDYNRIELKIFNTQTETLMSNNKM